MAEADTMVRNRADSATSSEHFDVLIAGAGISGIGAAYHLQEQGTGKSYAILECKDTFGGTWDTHKYPGIRSDSDLYTFGYRFKPWVGPPIAVASEILKYMGEVIEDNAIGDHIRYGHLITKCSWSSAENLWTVEARRRSDGTTQRFTCNFLWMCQGYYNHDTPYWPDWQSMDAFNGLLVHAQQWDPVTKIAGKRIVVIGSGATAATIVPAVAGNCAHVTMLQRSPTYFYPSPNNNLFADSMRAAGLDDATIHYTARVKVNYDQEVSTRRCVSEPETVRTELFAAAHAFLGEGYDLAPHFTPSYRPWQQRLAIIPDGDLFMAMNRGEASVVTDHIDRFVEKGILLKSGEVLEADIIIAATGFDLSVMGEIPFSVDGKAVDWAETVNYRGMMFTGVPNLAWVFGYFRASWTLRVDIMGDFMCALLKHLDAKGATRVEVQLRPEDHNMPLLPWIGEDNFNPGYIQRGLHRMPKRGDKPEWMHNQDYWAERHEIPAIDLTGTEFVYS